MIFVKDTHGVRINGKDASKNEKYFCPLCDKEVIVRQGDTNIHHFAHKKGECTDTWNYEPMSEWHAKWQSVYPEECQEVIVKSDNDEIHRADVLIDDIVIEFQHSPISSKDFYARNKFYRELGYKVVWIFDEKSNYTNNYISRVPDSNSMFYWKAWIQSSMDF